jgi:hypothetical protein
MKFCDNKGNNHGHSNIWCYKTGIHVHYLWKKNRTIIEVWSAAGHIVKETM